DKESILWVLQERGLSRDQVEEEVEKRLTKPWGRPYVFWKAARWFTIINTLVVSYFNLIGLFRLLNSDHIYKVPLVLLVIASILAGFFIGFKLTTHVYHGSKEFLYCGFPLAVGFVDLKTGEEIPTDKPIMNLRMAVNALAGVSLTLFPLTFIYFCIS
nr:hypothetical protein [Gammaproteobacteria bacterium]NIU89551.1 hypothetical protein [candidate division KSB1 bacterium]NIV70190.1 hypothetical protein [Phycisphaerae bacterium]NIQ11144.1 hypothetical protein [Gammaproteobacteria bacterium]NIR27675.1 hypothetical protein [Gammaproteobacteria bacterium]